MAGELLPPQELVLIDKRKNASGKNWMYSELSKVSVGGEGYKGSGSLSLGGRMI